VFPNFVPLNLANFPVFSQAGTTRTSLLFNLANPDVRALSPQLNVVAPGTLNTFVADNLVNLLVIQLFNLQLPGLSLFPTFPGLDLVLPAKNLKSPYSQHYALTIEHEFFKDYLGAVSYVGTRGVKLLRVSTPDRGLNRSFIDFASVRPLGDRSQAAAFPFFTGDMFSPQDAEVLASAFTLARTLFESSAASSFHSLQVEVRKRYSHGSQFGVAYTYSHAIDDASDFFDTAGGFALSQNSLQRSERASADFDVRHRAVVNFIWDVSVSFSKSSRWLGGWQLAGIVAAQSGQPFTVNSAFDVNRDGNLTDRPQSRDGSLAPNGVDGAVGRNTFRAPGIATVDVAITKKFDFGERHKVLFRTEVFNLFNRTHFGTPVRILEAPAFGRPVSTTIPARTIQFAVKYSF